MKPEPQGSQRKMKMRKQNRVEFISPQQYAALRNQAVRFSEFLKGDAGFERPEVNRIALEALLVGWMYAQPYWKAYAKHCRIAHKRENVALIAWDQALQAAEDAVGFDVRFTNSLT